MVVAGLMAGRQVIRVIKREKRAITYVLTTIPALPMTWHTQKATHTTATHFKEVGKISELNVVLQIKMKDVLRKRV